MISLLTNSPFPVIVLVIGAITYMIAKQGKPEQSRYLEFLLLTIVTICVFLFDNPLRSNPYAGLLFYVFDFYIFDFYIFTSASLAFSFTAIFIRVLNISRFTLVVTQNFLEQMLGL